MKQSLRVKHFSNFSQHYFEILAGLNLEIEIVDIIPEVYADLIYYLSKYDVQYDEKILIIDCGGGRISQQGYQIIVENNCKKIIHLTLPKQKTWQYDAQNLGGDNFERSAILGIDKTLKWTDLRKLRDKSYDYFLFKTIQNIQQSGETETVYV